MTRGGKCLGPTCGCATAFNGLKLASRAGGRDLRRMADCEPQCGGAPIPTAVRRVPRRWAADLSGVLISEAQIRRRVSALARLITHDYRGQDLVVVALLTGTVVFLADLVRRLPIPLRLDFMGASSYGTGTTARKLVYTKELALEVRDRDVLLVDDILDTGQTLRAVSEKVGRLGPRSVRICVLLDKPARRVVEVNADYVGFVVPDVFVVGYGLDYAERYRNLPFVGVLHPHLYGAQGGLSRADGSGP
jgi:hypoxanthine phosphoribosyltransferase